jgi:hypothetical protein
MERKYQNDWVAAIKPENKPIIPPIKSLSL